MKKLLGLVCACVLLGAGYPAPASADPLSQDLAVNSERSDYLGSLLVGLQGGVGWPVQTVDSALSGSMGYMVNASALYGIDRFTALPVNLLTGLDVTFAGHPVSVTGSGFNVGNASSVSFLPTVELRSDKIGNWAFYGSFGLGVNINNFSNSSGFNAACAGVGIGCTVSPGPSLGVRVALGTDYYITSNLGLNAEIGYLLNDPTSSVTLSAPGGSLTGNGSTNFSTFFLLFGIDYRTWFSKS